MNVADPYAGLQQSRGPLTAEDRAYLQKAAATGKVVGIVAGFIGFSIFAFAAMTAVSSFGAGDPVAGGFAVFGALFGLVFVGAGVYIVKSTARDATMTEKIVYVGVVTDKRRDVTHTPRGPNQADETHTREVLVIDGVDFGVRIDLWTQYETGMRVEMHCLRPGDVFRVERVG